MGKAFTDSDVDAIVRLHASGCLVYGTASKTVVVKTEGVAPISKNALLNNRPRGAKLTDYTAVVLSDTAVAVTGLDMLTAVRDGKTVSTTGRVTFVVAKRGADCKSCSFIARRSELTEIVSGNGSQRAMLVMTPGYLASVIRLRHHREGVMKLLRRKFLHLAAGAARCRRRRALPGASLGR